MTELEKAAREYCENVKQSTGRDSDPVNAFQAGAQWQAKQSPWISVEERLPKKGVPVLVQTKSWIGVASKQSTPVDEGLDALYWEGEDEEVLFDYDFEEVVSWMPIPE